ncbi:hypothetical protein M758_7G162600 [Ceratodon purpureus]|nr:hypothetical protein M758_7G162600 [Ceratodon purpureus]
MSLWLALLQTTLQNSNCFAFGTSACACFHLLPEPDSKCICSHIVSYSIVVLG